MGVSTLWWGRSRARVTTTSSSYTRVFRPQVGLVGCSIVWARALRADLLKGVNAGAMPVLQSSGLQGGRLP